MRTHTHTPAKSISKRCSSVDKIVKGTAGEMYSGLDYKGQLKSKLVLNQQ